jgi:hypothetical protein
MTRVLALAALLLAPAAAAAAADAVAMTPGSAPAEWRSWDLLVDLHNLPRAYTCDELWYRFHDVLLALGARPQMRITTFHCGTTAAQSTRSPSVQLQFQLPIALSGANVRYAQLSAVSTTVRLTPGAPHSLGADDCELLRQMNALLLPALPVHVLHASLACPAPAGSRHPYALEVQALVPRS